MFLPFILEVYCKFTVSQQQILDSLSFGICMLRSMHQWKVSVHNMNASGCEKEQWLSQVPEYVCKRNTPARDRTPAVQNGTNSVFSLWLTQRFWILDGRQCEGRSLLSTWQTWEPFYFNTQKKHNLLPPNPKCSCLVSNKKSTTATRNQKAPQWEKTKQAARNNSRSQVQPPAVLASNMADTAAATLGMPPIVVLLPPTIPTR
jgi:hypothetical protein